MRYDIGYSPEVDLAVQVILNCDTVDQGCHGGDPNTAYQYISQAGGIPSETCQLYEAEVKCRRRLRRFDLALLDRLGHNA